MNGHGSRRIRHAAAGVALLAGLLGSTTAPAHADILGGLLGGGSGSTASPSSTGSSGSLAMPDGRLRKGCENYFYTYSITVPSGDQWDLEIFVTDRRGTAQASDVILSGADALSGTKHVQLCRYNTVPGTFTLRGTLYTSDGANTTSTNVLPADTFKLTVHHKHKKRHH